MGRGGMGRGGGVNVGLAGQKARQLVRFAVDGHAAFVAYAHAAQWRARLAGHRHPEGLASARSRGGEGQHGGLAGAHGAASIARGHTRIGWTL